MPAGRRLAPASDFHADMTARPTPLPQVLRAGLMSSFRAVGVDTELSFSQAGQFQMTGLTETLSRRYRLSRRPTLELALILLCPSSYPEQHVRKLSCLPCCMTLPIREILAPGH